MNPLTQTIFSESPQKQKSFENHLNWPYLFLLKYKSEFQTEILEFSKKTQSSYGLFLQGIAKEYGVHTRRNLPVALSLYKAGADSNDAFCHFKLFYIYSEDYQKYHIQKNRDLAICHLVQSAAFWDPSLTKTDINCHVNPKNTLGQLLEEEDDKLVKIRSLIYKYFKNDENKHSFLSNWLMVEYPFETELASFHLSELAFLTESTEYPEACFYYGNSLLEEGLKQNDSELLDQAEEFLMIAIKANLVKAHFPLGKIYESKGCYNDAADIFKKGGKQGSISCLNTLASYYSNGLKTERNFRKAVKYAYKSFYLGDLTAGHVVKDIGRYMKIIGFDNMPEDLEKQIWLIAENLSVIQPEYTPTLHKVGANAYILSKCYTSGINCEKNLNKALDIINGALEHKENNNEDFKYLVYTKARLLNKLSFDDDELMIEAFKKYEEFIKAEKNKKYPQHYYRLAKLFEKGWGVEMNLKLAKENYEKGISCIQETPSMCWIQYFYLNKCKAKLNELEKNKDF